jgi:hypothetical protein
MTPLYAWPAQRLPLVYSRIQERFSASFHGTHGTATHFLPAQTADMPFSYFLESRSGDGIMHASVPFMLLALTGVIQP